MLRGSLTTFVWPPSTSQGPNINFSYLKFNNVADESPSIYHYTLSSKNKNDNELCATSKRRHIENIALTPNLHKVGYIDWCKNVE